MPQTEIEIMSQFFPLLTPPPPPKTPKKPRILKKWGKNAGEYHYFTHVYQKPQSYEVQFLTDRVRHIIFCPFGPFFCSFTSPNDTENQNFDFHYTHVYLKSQPYDVS